MGLLFKFKDTLLYTENSFILCVIPIDTEYPIDTKCPLDTEYNYTRNDRILYPHLRGNSPNVVSFLYVCIFFVLFCFAIYFKIFFKWLLFRLIHLFTQQSYLGPGVEPENTCDGQSRQHGEHEKLLNTELCPSCSKRLP